jgi:hypothetical protein
MGKIRYHKELRSKEQEIGEIIWKKNHKYLKMKWCRQIML